MPDVAELPDKGFPWQQQMAVNLKCVYGTDAGTEVVYKPTTDGGIQAVAGLIEAVRDRLNSGQHDGKVSPIVLLEKDSYPHPQYGKIWIAGADRSSTGCRWTVRHRRLSRRRRRPPSSRVAGASASTPMFT